MSFLSFFFEEIRSTPPYTPTFNTDGTMMVSDTGVDYEGKPYGVTYDDLHGQPEMFSCSFDSGLSGMGCGSNDGFGF